MKKIFLLLTLIYSYSFSAQECINWGALNIHSTFMYMSQCLTSLVSPNQFCGVNPNTQGSNYAKMSIGTSSRPCTDGQSLFPEPYIYDNFSCTYNSVTKVVTCAQPENGIYDDDGELLCNEGYEDVSGTCRKSMENGYLNENGNLECHEGFSNNGDYCVPNTPPNSCGSGYAKTGTNGLTGEDICYPDSDGNGTADILENPLPPAPDVPVSGVQIDGAGTKTWNIGGTTYELTTDGTLTTTYADGTKSVKQLDSDYYNNGSTGGSSGGTGTSGGSGSNGNTTNETNPNQNNTPVDDTPAANSCQDSTLTLQEKMLCEMNAGMKKLNSESNTQNSLNNLLKDLNNTSNTNATAINTNLKSSNTTLTGIKSLNENQLKEQKQTNDLLDRIENGNDSTNTLLAGLSSKFNPDSSITSDNPISGTDSIIDGFTSQYTNFYQNLLVQKDTLSNLAIDSQTLISEGFTLTLTNNDVSTCPNTFDLDLSSMNESNMPITFDLCKYSSSLKPFLYPLFLIIFSSSVTFFLFRFLLRIL